MGVERSFQALPADQRLIELALADREVGEVLSLAVSFFRQGGGPLRGPPSRAAEALLQAVRELLKRAPDLARRTATSISGGTRSTTCFRQVAGEAGPNRMMPCSMRPLRGRRR